MKEFSVTGLCYGNPCFFLSWKGSGRVSRNCFPVRLKFIITSSKHTPHFHHQTPQNPPPSSSTSHQPQKTLNTITTSSPYNKHRSGLVKAVAGLRCLYWYQRPPPHFFPYKPETFRSACNGFSYMDCGFRMIVNLPLRP